MTSVQYSRDFLDIWEYYPRKVGKLAAYKAFRALKCSSDDVDSIMDSIERHIYYDPQWKRSLGKFIPHLATFLNQRRFEDEI